MVAALRASESPSALFEHADELARAGGRSVGACSRCDGDALDLRRLGEGAAFGLENLEVSLDCVAGHFERFLTSFALGVAAGKSGTETLKPPTGSGWTKTSNSWCVATASA